jgi:hypothetical protein
MNGRTAKKIRKQVYGDQSLKSPRKYKAVHGTIINIGLRREYLDAKKK